MPPKSKSLFRKPGAQHFQLVHRSQRDPLINDPDASQHVLKSFERENVKKGKSRADLEDMLSEEIAAGHMPQNVGEASLYGIYYDDTEYNYMQHLRQVGVQEDGVESILIEAPSASKTKRAAKQPAFELPGGALPPTYELPRTYESQQAIPESISGFQPEMDPHLRQVLEALEDDAFVDDGLEEDFFQELVADGERPVGEEFDFDEQGFEETPDQDEGEVREETWEDRFKKFKQEKKNVEINSDDDMASEGGDTIGSLRTMSVIGGKRRRKGSSVASGYSMSSSSMVRHEGLKTLDERFDQMMLKEYGDEFDEDGRGCGDDHDHDHAHSYGRPDEELDDEEVPELITSRDDFDSMVNEFLNDYEILGRKMRPKLEGETGVDKLDTFRRALGEATIREGDDSEEEEVNEYYEDREDKKDRWDCETILTTFSNLENHPRLIRARTSKPVPKIVLDPKTGLPSVVAPNPKPPAKRATPSARHVSFSNSEDTDESDKDDDSVPRRAAVGRPRDETKEAKKARKAATKAVKQARRIEKKETQNQYDAEFKSQTKELAQKGMKMKKL